jgi:hypothetical protein
MFAEDRLARLRALVARLERLPASPETDWMLAEARARMVDVETGERPKRMRPRTEDPDPGPPPEPRERRRRVPVKPPAERAPRGEPVDRPRSAEPETPDDAGVALPPGTDGLLWLEDPASDGDASAARADDDPESQPWRRGLRG